MTERDRGLPPPRPINNISELANALENNPPEIFEDATWPIMVGSAESDPYFTMEAMTKRCVALRPVASEHDKSASYTSHFGQRYGYSQKLLKEGVLLGKDIMYPEVPGEKGFAPTRTIGLYSVAPVDSALMSMGIELTQYRDEHDDAINIYKLMKGKDQRVAVRSRNIGEILTSDLIRGSSKNSPRTFATSQLFVGAPDWREEYSRLLAENFGLIPRETKLFPT